MDRFPETLRTWRKLRRMSQLDLACEAEVSSRHLSFLETGRARPSADMVHRLAEALSIPLDIRNALLTQAGFAPRYGKRDWADAEMAPIRAAVSRMLTVHMPYPALSVDRLWTVGQMNGAAKTLFGLLGVGEGDSLLDLMMSDLLPPLVENWSEMAHLSARRLRLESAALGGVAALDRVADHLSARAGGPEFPVGPVIPTIYRAGDLRLSLFTTIAQFGTPADLSLDDLRIEMFFPADAGTEAVLRRWAD